jgi:hypothetical protein
VPLPQVASDRRAVMLSRGRPGGSLRGSSRATWRARAGGEIGGTRRRIFLEVQLLEIPPPFPESARRPQISYVSLDPSLPVLVILPTYRAEWH